MKDLLLHRILIVDDEPKYCVMIQQFLDKLGYSSEFVQNALDALSKLHEKRFDLVIADIHMSGMNGLELARAAKRQFPDIDFIIMSGHTSEYSYSDIIQAGSSDFIGKPFATADLKARLERIERERRVLQSLRETNNALLWESKVNSSLAELSKLVITSQSLDELSQQVLRHAKELTGSKFGIVGHLNRKGEMVLCPPADAQEAQWRQEKTFPGRFGHLWEKGLKTKQPSLVNALPTDRGTGGTKAGYGFLSVPALKDDSLLGQLAAIRTEPDFAEKDLTVARRLAVIYALGIQRAHADEELRDTQTKLRAMLEKTVTALTSALEIRDPYTAGHQTRVACLAGAIASEMGISGPALDVIRMAGLIHDIGKIFIPAELLSKPTRLLNVEMNLIKYHPNAGYEILKNVDLPSPISEVVMQHHERMNGSGYPLGLAGSEILMESRIVAVADVYEAMISDRPYRPSLGKETALRELSTNSGTLYDPEVVTVCLDLLLHKGFDFGHDNGNGRCGRTTPGMSAA